MNKTLLIALAISIAVSCLCCSCFSRPFSEDRKAAFQMIKEASHDYKKKYGLRYCGVREAAPEGKYEFLGIIVDCKRVLSREEGRKILVECYDDFLQRINNNENFKQYMQVYPFTEDNVSVVIFIQPPDQSFVSRPDIGIFALRKNEITYVTYPPDYLTGGKSSYDDVETLEQARSAIKQLENQRKFPKN